MTLPLVLRKYFDDGPFTSEQADQQWTDIEEAVNELNDKKLDGIGYQERTSGTQLLIADNGRWINITSGTFDQSFSAAADLGSNWFVVLQNSGTGLVTLKPAGAETIDSRTSYVMYPREIRLIQCDGLSLRSIVLKPFEIEFAPGVYMPAAVGNVATGEFIKPPGYSYFGGIIWGAGCSGQKGSTAIYGGGSGAGFPFRIPEDQLTAVHEFTVGKGGDPVTGASGVGKAGGDSELIPGISAAGGSAHTSLSNASAGGVASVGGNVNIFGPSTSSTSLYGGQTSQFQSLQNYYGSGAGGSFNPTGGIIIPPGTSLFGDSGGITGVDENAGDGESRGAGGGVCRSSNAAHLSGAGADGALLIRGII